MCMICDFVENKKEHLTVYEDKKVKAVMCPEPANPGHILLFPKEHYPIIEQVPDYLVGYTFEVANKISTAVFEALKAHGTNILVNNGVDANQTHPHFFVQIIPRWENDQLDLSWEPKQGAKEELAEMETLLKSDFSGEILFEKENKPAAPVEEKKIEHIEDKPNEENYMIKSLRRVP